MAAAPRLRRDLTPVSEAIRYAREEAAGLVVLADGSDNPGGGGPCDGTVVLRELQAAGVEDAVVAVIADQEVVAAAAAAGVRETIEVRLGGKTDRRHGEPLALRASVRLLSDGRFVTRGRSGMVALKSAVHFRSTYQEIAERIFDLDTPGVHRPDFTCYDYRRLRHGLYPLDRNARFPRSGPG